MGGAKASKPLKDVPLLRRVIDILSPLLDEVIIVTDNPDNLSSIEDDLLGYEVITDSSYLGDPNEFLDFCSPTKSIKTSQNQYDEGGQKKIKSCLEVNFKHLESDSKDSDLNNSVESNQPPLSSTLQGLSAGLMASNNMYSLVVGCDMPFLNPGLINYMAEKSLGADAVVPKVNDYLEPLHAIYSKTCLPTIKKALKFKQYSLNLLFPLLTVNYVYEDEIKVFDPQLLSFFNLNTMADFQRAELILEEIKLKA